MLLTARLLQNALSVNVFELVNQIEFTEGDTPSIFFQLIDATLDKSGDGFSPPGRRYMPAVGATLNVTLDSLDNAKRITRAASQPFAQDPSIWKIDILTTDKVLGTVTLRLQLTEGQKVTSGSVIHALRVSPARL